MSGTEFPLEESRFVDDVGTGIDHPVGVPFLCSHNDECKAGLIKHCLEPFDSRQTGSWLHIEFVARKGECLPKKILKLQPDKRPSVADEDLASQ
ncbi:MAG: hypothetical protein A3F77_17175 [Betaproteobacteria bacterium RIFCSPLOWO2_12_FULL_67_28]|nr:MAG: hypothetical protein A3F77_17175 [Betaproteobacteria bacterium RIFCSPLOWO2_12_FULL_67_28]